MPSYINKSVVETKKSLNSYGIDVVVLGSGDTIINQYPNKGSKINKVDKVFLLSEGDITMPDFTNYSMKDVNSFLTLVHIDKEITGNGYVLTQSVPPGTVIDGNTKLVLEFGTKK